jgi:hypothetical protein
MGDAVGNATEVMEIDELVVPLCEDADGILEEGDDDKEAANGGEIAIEQEQLARVDTKTSARRRLVSREASADGQNVGDIRGMADTSWCISPQGMPEENIRLQRLAQPI